jgi:hypothetical protein
MKRPISWSVWETKPAYTSAIRTNSRCSSCVSESQGRTKSSIGQGAPSGLVMPCGSPCGLIGESSTSLGRSPSSFSFARISVRIAS